MNILRFGSHQTGVGNHPGILKTPGRFVIISGPSGVGKGTILGELFKQPDLQGKIASIPSVKTRPLRPGEKNGVDLRSVTTDEFQRLKKANKLFQWTLYDNNWYGTLASDVMKQLGKGVNVLCEMTADMALMIKRKYPAKVTTVFIDPPAPKLETLRQRITGRGTNDAVSIEARLNEAKAEMALSPEFDHLIVSETGQIPKAVEQLKAVVTQNAFGLNKKDHSVA